MKKKKKILWKILAYLGMQKMPAVPAHCTSVWISPNVGKKLSQHAKHDKNIKTQFLLLKNEEQVHAFLGGSLKSLEHCNLEQMSTQKSSYHANEFYQTGWHE